VRIHDFGSIAVPLRETRIDHGVVGMPGLSLETNFTLQTPQSRCPSHDRHPKPATMKLAGIGVVRARTAVVMPAAFGMPALSGRFGNESGS
jgi:hypothetical protein